MRRYFARKTICQQGHTHASKREAGRCDELHVLQAAGEIVGLRVEPRFHFIVEGDYLKARNGHRIRYTADFTYIQNQKQIVEDVKAKNIHMERDVPVKFALMARCYPDIEVRIVT